MDTKALGTEYQGVFNSKSDDLVLIHASLNNASMRCCAL